MDFLLARTFVAVAREGSFTRAARRLDRTQPTLTAAVAKLEAALGAELFERAGRGVRLTRAGRLLLDELGPLLDSWEAADTRFRHALTGTTAGRVRLAGNETAVTHVFPGPLRRFLKTHPRVEVEVTGLPAGEALAALRAGAVDLAALPAPPPDADGVSCRPLVAADRVLIAPREHPLARGPGLSLRDVARHPLILPFRGTATRAALEAAFERLGLEPRVALDGAGWEGMKRYVGLGLGVGVLPAFCLDRPDRRLASRPARHLFGRSAYVLASPSRANLAPQVAALLEALAPRG